jgi:hypothetical protein
VRAALRTRSFWVIALGLCSFWIYLLALPEPLVLFLVDHGTPRDAAARQLSNAIFLGIFSQVAFGALADRLSPRIAVLLDFGLLAASSALPLLLPDPTLIWLFVGIFGFSSATRDVVTPLIVAHRLRSDRLGPAAARYPGASRLHPHPAGQRDVRADRLEDGAHRRPDLDGGGIDLVDGAALARHEIADEPDPGVLVQRHDDHGIGGELRELRDQRRVGHGERPDRSAPRYGGPDGSRVGRPGTHRARREDQAPRLRAALHAQLAGATALEEGGRVLVVGGQQPILGHHALRSSMALVGTPSPPVTRQVSASRTWLTESPRS